MSAVCPPLLSLQKVTKTFPGVVANAAVSLNLNAGEIHAVLGENGAGKSTLVKMIYGMFAPDYGQITWQGKVVKIHSPRAAMDLGIAMVFQHFSLFESLSVLDNIILGLPKPTAAQKHLPRRVINHQIQNICDQYHLPIEPDRMVYTLSAGQRQRVEIVRCLLQQPKLLIMDEPTSVLTPNEVSGLFATLRTLAKDGMAILYISHKLTEIIKLCSRATILRGGKVIDSTEIKFETANSLAAKMMGVRVNSSTNFQSNSTPNSKPISPDNSKLYTRPNHHAGRPPINAESPIRLQVSQLHHSPEDAVGIALRDINLTVRAGEIVGIAGVAGNGQDELLGILSGEIVTGRPDSILINGIPCGGAGINLRRKLGLACVPATRIGHGAIGQMRLLENGLLTAHQRLNLINNGFIRYGPSHRFAAKIMKMFAVKSGGKRALAGSLSGGNLQKFIVGREICQRPQLFIIAQPTWGVDAAAAQTIRASLSDMAAAGAALVIISQDLDELVDICDSICAICSGILSPVYPVGQLTVDKIGLLMGGQTLN